jgi:phage gp46-like protein
MAQNLLLDPSSKDYILVDGSPVETSGVDMASYFSLMIPEGDYMYGSVGQGSYLYTLDNQKRDRTVEQEFQALANDALQRQVVKTGIASDLLTSNTATARTSSSNNIKLAISQSNLSDELGFVSV